ncbi:uncharacterized protein [Solanum tuberosum]|uniref:uncharacterized protein isoform X6 n=1 Tax=Solanum tuberosum TaxID=4113 RepID=UPI0003D241B7|nr:PREDICTED: uncharacterized protein LOC102586186 isoform X6 [Solanum tuberosum]
MDKKVIPPASSSQEKACQYSTDRASIINNRRCSIYKQLSSDKKEALLLQRRRRYRQLTNKNLLGRAPTPLPNVQLHFTAEKGVTITDIPPHPETGDTSHIDTFAVVSGKAKDMIGCLSIFEVGSTLAAPVKQHSPIAITVTTKGSASLAHQQYDPKAITDKNNGGSGKTFLYRALLATVRSKGFIALATTTSGVAASILPGGRTAHSRFKIPINIDEQFSCNISLISLSSTCPEGAPHHSNGGSKVSCTVKF